MVKRNNNMKKLKAGYLFPEINKRKNEFMKNNPDAKIISLGIGDTTEPLTPYITKKFTEAANGLGTNEGYSGYGAEQGMNALREKIAEKLYDSALFKLNLKYARHLNADKIFILSAKYGLVELDREIEPYEKTLNKMSDSEVRVWALDVLSELNKISNLKKDEFIFLAGKRYRKYLINDIENFKVPMRGMGIGKQLKWLKERIKNGDV